jgi:hypothetical protein
MKKEINGLKAEVSRLQEAQYQQARGRPTSQSTGTARGSTSGTLSSAYASSKTTTTSATNANGAMKTTTSTLRSNIPKK